MSKRYAISLAFLPFIVTCGGDEGHWLRAREWDSTWARPASERGDTTVEGEAARASVRAGRVIWLMRAAREVELRALRRDRGV
eukprot:5492489-Pleurochrysis_carterae.AAC.2